MERSSNHGAIACPAQTPETRNTDLRLPLQFAIAATLLVVVLWHVGWQSVVRQLAGVEPTLLLVTAALCVADGLIRA